MTLRQQLLSDTKAVLRYKDGKLAYWSEIDGALVLEANQ